jgi:hypothetical protein
VMKSCLSGLVNSKGRVPPCRTRTYVGRVPKGEEATKPRVETREKKVLFEIQIFKSPILSDFRSSVWELNLFGTNCEISQTNRLTRNQLTLHTVLSTQVTVRIARRKTRVRLRRLIRASILSLLGALAQPADVNIGTWQLVKRISLLAAFFLLS